MARLTRLDDGDIRALAAAFALGEVTVWGEVPAGTINSNHWVEAGGRRWFLRVNEGKSEADVRYEAGLIGELAARGVATPRPVVSIAGEPLALRRDRWVSVFPWVEGSQRALGEVSAADARAVGGALARLHRAGAGLVDHFARDGIYTTAHIAARVEAVAADPRVAADPALTAAVADTREEMAWLDGRAADRARAPRGIIHGDLFRDNVLFAGACEGEGSCVAALLDFEQASLGAWVYDLAVCANAWCYTDQVVPELCAHLAAGYREVRPLDAVERALLWTELRASAVRFAVTRITDVYLPGADLPGKDFRRYLARLHAWREVGEAGTSALFGE
jgi:homoserine kinase type II